MSSPQTPAVPTAGSAPVPQAPGSRDRAVRVVDLALKAADAYQRPDLAERVRRARERLTSTDYHVLVVGEFKQGKSTLVNALLNVGICPVDDDIATSLPIILRHGEQAVAIVAFEPEQPLPAPGSAPTTAATDAPPPPKLVEVPIDQVHLYASEAGNPRNAKRVRFVEVRLPRQLLASGMALVDTPGVGGLDSSSGTITLGALRNAEGVVFVSDASQEFSDPELRFLRKAFDLCPNLVVALTKTDFYPQWRRVADIDREHLDAAGLEQVEILPVSSTLRQIATRTEDRALNEESGYTRLVGYLRDTLGARAATLAAEVAASVVLDATSQLEESFLVERDSLSDPEKAAALMSQLEQAKIRADRLRTQAARWHQTLSDGVADLSADVDFDLRNRIRSITRDADAAIDANDPADCWDEFEQWLYQRVTAEIVDNYQMLYRSASELAERVSEHFAVDGIEVSYAPLRIDSPFDSMYRADAMKDPDLQSMGGSGKAMAAMRGSYGSVMMFGMMSGLIGFSLINPFTLIAGVGMGRKALRDEKERQLMNRRNQARQAYRRFLDEVVFFVGKDSRDAIRLVQRHLRDEFTARAEEIQNTLNEAMRVAQNALKGDEDQRKKRLPDVEAELKRLAALREQALSLTAG